MFQTSTYWPGVTFGRNVRQVNRHRWRSRIFYVTLWRWRPERHFTQQSSTTLWVNTKRLPAPMQQPP